MIRAFQAAMGASVLVVALCAAAPASAQAQTPAKYERMANTLWSLVNEHYYDPHFRGADWSGARERYRARVRAVRTDTEFQTLADAMLREIPSSHLYVSPPATVGSRGIGARFATIEGQRIVTEVAPLSDARARGLLPGDHLLSDPDALRGEFGETATVQVEHCDGRRSRLSIRREQAFWPPEHPGFRWTRLTRSPNESIGYLRIDRFDDGAAALADRAMAELKDTQALIIDIRGNSGGNVSALRLASYFGPGAESAAVLFARPYLEALGHPVTPADIAAAPRVNGAYTTEAVFAAMSSHRGGAAFWTDDIAEKYTRPVVVLVGEDTGSAAEGFAWYMRTRTHARLIGRETAGALLSSDRFDLGDGWSVTIPVHGAWAGDGADYADRAVPPHERVSWTRADLCADRDPDLAAALRAISSR